jgi:tRNA pseudouridine55 synthase
MNRNRGRNNSEAGGLVLLDKTPGRTSFESLALVKKAFDTNKVGHTGTLDKFASGLLVILVGRAVKLSPWFSGCDKRYEGTILFGVETDTLDPEGAVIAEAAPPSREALEGALERFRGDILQAPPIYSAVHVRGDRAYKLARAGEAVEMVKRPVSIYALELVSYEPPLAEIRVHCSKGAYIRSLARDLALAAGSRGHLLSLRRTQVAGFTLAGALPGREGPEKRPPGEPPPREAAEFPGGAAALRAALRPIDAGVFRALGLPRYTADDETVRNMIRGKAPDTLVDPAGFPPDSTALGVFTGTGALAAVLEKESPEGKWRYGYVYARNPAEPGGGRAGA